MNRIIIVILVSAAIIYSQSLTLTLEQSLELGLKNSKELRISQSKIDYAEAMIDDISSSMLPKISFTAGFARLSDAPPFEIDLPIFDEPITIQESILNNYTMKLSVEQPLFTGFKLSSLKSASVLSYKAEKINLDKDKSNKAVDIYNTFWKFYTADRIKTLMAENLEALRAHVKNTEAMLKNGLVTKNDLLKLKVEAANAELNLVDAENNKNKLQVLFNKVVGLPLHQSTELIINDNNKEFSSDNYLDLINEAKNNRQELKTAKLQLNALGEKESSAKADWYPQLYAFGNFYYNNPHQRFLPLEDKFNDSWDVGVSLKWNLWNWGGTSAKVEEAKQNFIQFKNTFELMEENILMDVYNKYLDVKKARKKIELSKLQLESAEENYRITKEKYYQQFATSTDLIDAETAILNSKTSLLTSEIEFQLNSIELENALGRKVYEW